MAAALEETPVSYEDLAKIERDFDDAELEIIRYQALRLKDLYATRSKIVSQIPNFWPLVLEQAPLDIDQFIQPSDSALLLSALTNLSVTHFEIETPSASGDPRSVAIKFEFSTNEYFSECVLEKKFWYRRARDGWCGLVSEPVKIGWKKDRDLTGGLLDLVCEAWEAERRDGPLEKGAELREEQKALKKKIQGSAMGGLSFFAWFGFMGRHISAEESQEANRIEGEKKNATAEGKATKEEPVDDVDYSFEIFPEGDDLAVAITEDLWPSALKYFTQAQELDALSDGDFESDNEEMVNALLKGDKEGDSGSNSGRPSKKQRSS